MNMDRINPRVWLRNWLLKPTAAEASTNGQMPGRITLQAEYFKVRDNLAQGSPTPQPFGIGEDGVSLDQRIAQQIDLAFRPGGALHGRGPYASWSLKLDGEFRIQGMAPAEGQTDEPV